MSQATQHKALARGIRAALQEKGMQLSHGECLDVVARASGLKNWNVLSAFLDKGSGSTTNERCDFCGLPEADAGRLIFSGPFSNAICLRCAEDCIDKALHRDLRDRLDQPADGEAFLAGKSTAELERYAGVLSRRIAEKERAVEQMNALLARRAPDEVALQPGVETIRWAWLVTRTRAEVTGHRDGQLIELERSRAARALIAEQLQSLGSA